jgi:hypothetical protein
VCQSTESPILFRSCGHETPFSGQKWASKIGDSVLWCVCVLLSPLANRARNPRFNFVHAGTKPRFLTKNGHQKSGIPCSACKPFTKEKHSTDSNASPSYHACVQSTESPILDAPFWSDNGVSCPCERNKIGDSALCVCVCVFSRVTCN